MSISRPPATYNPAHAPETKAVDETALLVATKIFNVVVPLCFVIFALYHVIAFFQTWRLSNLIALSTVAVALQFHARRFTVPFIRTSAYAWLVALGGTVAPLLLRPTGDPYDCSVATVLQVIGAAMLIYVISTLNQSTEELTARCGVSREGWYRFVRHPLYLAYVVGLYGYVLNHTTLFNLFICALAIFCYVLRINEEELLLTEDEQFQDYARRTPWRIIPKVF